MPRYPPVRPCAPTVPRCALRSCPLNLRLPTRPDFDANVVFTMTEIDKYGMREIMGRALSLAGADTPGVHVSFDVDVIDPTEAPGVGDPVPPGSHLRESGTLSLRTAGT